MFGNLDLALQITVIGMGIVFAAIVLLWGIIALLVKATADASLAEPAETPVAVGLPVTAKQLRQRATAVAVAVTVALALEEQQLKTDFSPLPPHPISPWQAMLRGKQREQLERRGRTR